MTGLEESTNMRDISGSGSLCKQSHRSYCCLTEVVEAIENIEQKPHPHIAILNPAQHLLGQGKGGRKFTSPEISPLPRSLALSLRA